MALKFLACTIRPTNPKFADQILELWDEYEEGKTRAALLAKQMDKLECIQQAVIYEERTGKDMSDFILLKEKVTLPELKPLLDTCLQKYDELKLRRQADIVVVFVSGIAY
jgi:5'-deoxynucleotidase YfbR-like HD superfamily hydrolase